MAKPKEERKGQESRRTAQRNQLAKTRGRENQGRSNDHRETHVKKEDCGKELESCRRVSLPHHVGQNPEEACVSWD